MHSIGRRSFLRSAASAAALTFTSRLSAFGRTKTLRITAAVPPNNQADRLPPEWYRRKIAQVQEEMARRKLDALVLLNSHNVIYTTGYFHLSTERPLGVLIAKSGDPTLFVPASKPTR
jgi:hypothetical protein